MRDIADARDWVNNHQDFTHDMKYGLSKVMAAFRYLARYNFDAPWATDTKVKVKQS